MGFSTCTFWSECRWQMKTRYSSPLVPSLIKYRNDAFIPCIDSHSSSVLVIIRTVTQSISTRREFPFNQKYHVSSSSSFVCDLFRRFWCDMLKLTKIISSSRWRFMGCFMLGKQCSVTIRLATHITCRNLIRVSWLFMICISMHLETKLGCELSTTVFTL